jgi:hypothetical protein
MELIYLSKTDREVYGADIMVKYDFNDVAAATSGTAVPAISVLAGTKVQCVGHVMDTAFDVTGTGALTLSVGDGGSATAVMAATVLAVDGTEVFYHVGGSAKVYLVDDNVDLFFTDATSMAYTAGAGRLFFAVNDMNKWAKF